MLIDSRTRMMFGQSWLVHCVDLQLLTGSETVKSTPNYWVGDEKKARLSHFSMAIINNNSLLLFSPLLGRGMQSS